MTNGKSKITAAEAKRRKEQSLRDKRAASKSGSKSGSRRTRSYPTSGQARGGNFTGSGGFSNVPGSIPAARARKERGINRYLASILNPESTPPCQIPDYITWKSSCLKCKTEFTVPTGTAGEFAIVVQPQLTDFYRSYLYTAGVMARTDAGTQVSDYTQITNMYSHYRVVSMGAHVYYIGDNQNESGEFLAGVAPSWNDITGKTVQNSIDLMSEWSYIPVKRGARAIYYPVDDADREYVAVTASNPSPAPALYLLGTGLPASKTAYVKCCITMNVELLPKPSYTHLVAATPSTSNVTDMQQAANAMSLVPPISALDVITSGISAPKMKGKKPFMDRIGYGFDRFAGDVGDKLLDMVEEKGMQAAKALFGEFF